MVVREVAAVVAFIRKTFFVVRNVAGAERMVVVVSHRKWVRFDRKSVHKVLGVPVACVIPVKQERGPRLVLCLRKNSVLREALGVLFG